jgi:hypothetical protein
MCRWPAARAAGGRPAACLHNHGQNPPNSAPKVENSTRSSSAWTPT